MNKIKLILILTCLFLTQYSLANKVTNLITDNSGHGSSSIFPQNFI